MAGKQTDWEALGVEYRAGAVSVRELARKYDVSEGAIRKKAKANQWERDLTEKVQERVRSKLVRSEVRTPMRVPKCVPRLRLLRPQQRLRCRWCRSIGVMCVNGRTICAALFAELQDTSDNREIIAECIDGETQDDLSPTRRNQMMKAISLPTGRGRCWICRLAMKNLVAVERQAFSLDDKQDKQDGKTIVLNMSRRRNNPDE